jgi:hypothetical protein
MPLLLDSDRLINGLKVNFTLDDREHHLASKPAVSIDFCIAIIDQGARSYASVYNKPKSIYLKEHMP